MARGKEWDLLGLGSDPVPGDPSKLHSLIFNTGYLADETERAKRGMVGLLGDPALTSWLGASGDAFKGACAPLPDQLGRLKQAYDDVSAALKTYQTALTNAQGKADGACADAVSAYAKYSVVGDKPPGAVDDGAYKTWVQKLEVDLFEYHNGLPDDATDAQQISYQKRLANVSRGTSFEQGRLLAARSAAVEAQQANITAANAFKTSMEDAISIARAIAKITGPGANLPGTTFDERFKNAGGGDPTQLVLDPAAGGDVESAEIPGDPTQVANWWNSLDDAAKQRFIHEHPGDIANLDGIPQDVRDQANAILHPPTSGDDGDTGGRHRHRGGSDDGSRHHGGGDHDSGGRHRGGDDSRHHGGDHDGDDRHRHHGGDHDGDDRHRRHGGDHDGPPGHDDHDGDDRRRHHGGDHDGPPGHDDHDRDDRRHYGDPGRHRAPGDEWLTHPGKDRDAPGHFEHVYPGREEWFDEAHHEHVYPGHDVPGHFEHAGPGGPQDIDVPPHHLTDVPGDEFRAGPGHRITMPGYDAPAHQPPHVAPTHPAPTHVTPPHIADHPVAAPHHTAPTHHAPHTPRVDHDTDLWLPGAGTPHVDATLDAGLLPGAGTPRVSVDIDGAAWLPSTEASHEPDFDEPLVEGHRRFYV